MLSRLYVADEFRSPARPSRSEATAPAEPG